MSRQELLADLSRHGGIISYVSFAVDGQLTMLMISDIYSAAMVMIAGHLRPAIMAEVTEESIARSWHCALEVLRKYRRYSTSAERCVAALEILYERVVSEGPSSADQPTSYQPMGPPPATLNDMSLGEGVNAAFLDGFDLPDFQDMSWLNSVPSNLY